MITTVSCDLLLQATCQLVNLSTTNKALRMSLIARILIVK